MHLLKNVTVADTQSPHNGQTVDLRIAAGKIAEIGAKLEDQDGEQLVNLEGAFVSPGFIDIGPYVGDPGHEEKEDLASLAAAAQRGGYVAVAPLPNTLPARHDKSGISYLIDRSTHLPVKMLPLGAISRDVAGKDITEMLDMVKAGAVGFTDGLEPVISAGLLSRALRYVKAFSGTVINQPFDTELAPGGQIHEGEISTQLGLRGLPELCETLNVHRDLSLLDYTDSRLLIHLVSSATSLPMIALAKEKGLQAFASVAIHNLQFTVGELASFDANFKLLPPLRTEGDRTALIEALHKGTIDCVVSNHRAHVPEEKELEFPYAEFGGPSLESCFAQALTVLVPTLPIDQIAAVFSHGPRRTLALTPQYIAIDQPAEFSFFRTDIEWQFSAKDMAGKDHRSALIDYPLRGKAIATYFDQQ
ncbi:MAG: dihydroorotase, partial [Bacteroidota bacterium]